MADHPGERRTTEPNYVLRALEFFAQMGSAEAIVHGERRLTYTETRAAVLAMAHALSACGVRGDMTVVLVTRNHPESIILQLALHLLGCRTGFVATYAPYRDQLDFIEHAHADALVHDSGLADDLLAEALARGGRPVLSLGPEEGRPDLLAEMVVAIAASEADWARDAAAGYEPQSLFYTSGTTGQPKLVLHRQRFYDALFLGGQFYRSSGEPAMRHLATQEFSTTSGQMPGLLALFQGGAAILATAYAMDQVLATIERERVSSLFFSPLRLRDVLSDPALARTDCSILRYINCGGSAASPTVLAEAIERFGPVVRIVYGMTELPLITDYPSLDTDPQHPERLRSCGTPFADARLEVRDEHGNQLPTGETGEVWATGTLVMDGYFGQPELTRQTLADGWVHTGDVGYLDADGYLYLVDRSKDVIITSKRTLKVYSRVIEDILLSHPAVRGAAVIGLPDEQLGEAVHAFVVTEPGGTVTPRELRDLVGGELKDDFAPREVHFVSELPVTPADKVDKKALRAQYGQP
jgi:acyl-CoA synthetase (AMP-forming)/AMP-acid ligase II